VADLMSGNLAVFPLADLVKMLCAGGQTGLVELSEGLNLGGIYLRDGALVHAVAGPRVGEQALLEMLAWLRADFRFEPRTPPREESIGRSTDEVLRWCAAEATEREAIREVIPSGEAILSMAAVAPPIAVTVQPDEWRALALMDGRRTVAEIAAALGREELDLSRMLYRLAFDGLLKTSGKPAPPPAATVNVGFFDRLTREATSALGPIGPFIVDDEIAAQGVTREAFPRDKVAQLVERISIEIRDTARRLQFKRNMLEVLRTA
jgi:hypothetical protein